jgi:hypothetical protein
MAQRQTLRKDIRNLTRDLDSDELEQVFKFAKTLADSDSGRTPESLVEGQSLPSFTAAVDEDAYERKKARKERKEELYGQG